MKRLLLRVTLLVALYASVALGGPSAEIVVAKPTQSSPGTDLRDEELQKAYDEMWSTFQSDVNETTADLKKILGELREEAQKGGHAALTQKWDSISRDFATKGEVRWDHIKEKKDWRANYPGTVCPERFNRAVKACVNAYDQARRDLRAAYDDLARRLTVADKVERAKEIIEEATIILGAQVDGPKKPVPPPPQMTLLQRLVGKWTHQKSELMYYFLPDGTFHEDRKADGKVNATGRVVLPSPDLAEITLSNAYRIQIRMAGDDLLAVLVWDARGNPWGQGMVLERQKDRAPPKEAKVFGGHHYMFVAGQLSWDDAKRKCEEMGGHLITIVGPQENAFAFQLSQGKPFWIGMYFDVAKNKRVWVTGEPVTFEKWRPGQPEGAGNPYVGIAWMGKDEWDDFTPRPDGFQNFICEWEM